MTARPGRIKDTLPVSLPRPRSVSDPALAAVAQAALDHLREEIETAEREEFDSGWLYPENRVPAAGAGSVAGSR
jgi:hypothetical protein